MKKKPVSIIESYALYLYLKKLQIQGFACFGTGLFLYERFRSKKRSAKRQNNAVSNIAYRFCGYPEEAIASELNQNIGNCRYLWNRMNADFRDGVMLRTPAGYKADAECTWLALSDSVALCNTQKAFHRAVDDFLSGDKGKPSFKKKRYAKRSYTTSLSNAKSPNLHLDDDMLTLPKISAPIKLKLHREVISGGILKSCTVTHEPNGKWYFSLTFEYPLEPEIYTDALTELMESGDISDLRHIGLDMSLPRLYVDSNGNAASYGYSDIIVSFEKFYRNAEAKLAKEQRKLSRMEQDSSNYQKQKLKIAKLHARIKHQRSDFLHQLSVRLARSYDIVSIEDLDMRAIKRSLNFGKSASDNGWGMFTAMLERKLRARGGLLIRVNKWFPSSRTCSVCGYVHYELELSDRTYVCPVCGNVIDRDMNAAINIDDEGLRLAISLLTGGDAGASLRKPRKARRAPTANNYGIAVNVQLARPVTQEGCSAPAR